MGVSETIDKKRETLRAIASDFASGKIDERAYEEKTSSLFAEIAELKPLVEEEEKLRKQYRVTYADIVGFQVLLDEKVVGRITDVDVRDGKPALILKGSTCPGCKSLIEENAKFCVECGAAL